MIQERLKRFGYIPIGERFARPSGKSPSVHILSGGFSFHHSTNDPLHDGHKHSAFYGFCHFEHGGDFKTAFRVAADELGMDPSQSEEERRSARCEATSKQAEELGLLSSKSAGAS